MVKPGFTFGFYIKPKLFMIKPNFALKQLGMKTLLDGKSIVNVKKLKFNFKNYLTFTFLKISLMKDFL